MMGWGTCCGFGGLGRGMGLMGGGGVLGILGALLALGLFLGLLSLFAVGVVWAVRSSRSSQRGAGALVGERGGGERSFGERPLELAQRRLALGEISLEEYQGIRDQLRE